jgi:hypothetical protein
MKTYILLICLFVTFRLFAQDDIRKFDFRFGIGSTFIGSGDRLALSCENELNYRITRFISSSFSLGYGRSNNGIFRTVSYFQGDIGIYISPFGNIKKNDFRIGTGLSLMNISNYYQRLAIYQNDVLIRSEYQTDIKNTIGYSLIMEDSYMIRDKFLIGLKLFIHPYFDGDINSGLLLKLGMKI